MANPRAKGKKAGHGPELVQYVRRILLGAFEVHANTGQKITEVLAKELADNPLKFLEVASKYCPKEVAMEMDGVVTHYVGDLSDEQLANIAAGRSQGAAEAADSAQEPPDLH